MVLPSHSAYPEFCAFDVDIDGKRTRCVANFDTDELIIHMSGTSRHHSLSEFSRFEGDICAFLEDQLSDNLA